MCRRESRLSVLASLLWGLVAAVACGCGPTVSAGDDGGVDAWRRPDGGPGRDGRRDGAAGRLELTGVEPSAGPVSGGTPIVLTGRAFAAGAKVKLGGKEATAVKLASDRRIECKTPPAEAEGQVTVRVENPDGKYAELVGGFAYRREGARVDACKLAGPAAAESRPGEATPRLLGRVFAKGITEAAGQGAGLDMQVGFGPPNSQPSGSEWTFVAASYNPSCSDCGTWDEYSGAFTVAQPGPYDYAYRVTADGGKTWVYCDLDGSENGYSPAQSGKLTVKPAQSPVVDFCTLVGPSAIDVETGEATPEILGQVYAKAITEGAGQGSGITAQVGFGPAGSDPTQSTSGWAFVGASYQGDADETAGDKKRDQYRAVLTPGSPGTFDYAYRFSLDAGRSWVYCDLDASTNGYSAAQAGRLTVTAPPRPGVVDWCQLEGPATLSATPGEETPPVYGRVYKDAVTAGAGAGTGIRGQLGYGPQGSDPASGSGWTFVDAEYDSDVDGLVAGDKANDRYRAVLTAPAAGSYDYAYRFSTDDGKTWTSCDLGGSGDGYSAAQAGKLTVAAGKLVDWCNLQHPPALQMIPGVESEPVYGRVFKAGLTPGAGAGSGIRGQLGYGPEGSDPTTNSGEWKFVDATYLKDVDGLIAGALDNDEYVAKLTIAQAGRYDFAYRFSLDDGQSWTACDLDGTVEGGYTPAQAGKATVAAPAIEWCGLRWPLSLSGEPGKPAGPIYGQLLVVGVTDREGQGAGISAEVGFGPRGTMPTANGWKFVAASYNTDCTTCGGANDEYLGSVTATQVGDYDYAFRFSTDGGKQWTFCDLDGSQQGGYTPDQAGKLSVALAPPPTVDWCALKSPSLMRLAVATPDANAPMVYGQVMRKGVTPGAGQGAGIRAELGRGPRGSDPTQPGASWTFVAASYNPSCSTCGSDNDEYMAKLQAGTAGEWDYAYRFSMDDGKTWVVCDLDASDNGYASEQAGKLTVTGQVDWCGLKSPPTVSLAPGADTPAIYGQVWMLGVTEGDGQGAGIRGQVGYGPRGGDPSGAGWTFVDATYNPQCTTCGASNDEYLATFKAPSAGDYDYAYRFSADGGTSWTTCDLDGSSQGGYTPDQAGKLTVTGTPPPPIEWCKLMWPETITVARNVASPEVYGQLLVPGVTPGAGQGAGVRAELGYGPVGSDPTQSTVGWSFAAASYNPTCSTCGEANDEYMATLTVATAGDYDYAYRFSTDAGASWSYCDLDSDDNGYDTAQAGKLTVSGP